MKKPILLGFLFAAFFLNLGYGAGNEAEKQFNLGVELDEQGKTEEAITAYRKAIKLKPDFVWAYCNLGAALWVQGKHDEEIATYRKVIALKPDFAMGYVNLGVALAEQGKTEEAIAAYRKAISLKTDGNFAHFNLACLYAKHGRKKEALKSLRTVVDIGFDEWTWMEKEKDLDTLRGEAQFKELADTVKARWAERMKKEGQLE